MSRRVSTRMKGRPCVSLAETTADTDEEFMQSDALAPAKPSRSKKRKTSETRNESRAVGGSKPKRLKGNRGLLRALVEMPLDILFEIFGCLQPLDLLHLARTSKALRALLMARSSLSVWKQTFLNIPDPSPPECPGDLNQPQYAELLFGKACSFCGKSVGKIHKVWTARVRVCTKCLDEHFEEVDYFHTKPYGDELFVLLPSLELSRKCGRHARGKVFIYPPVDRAWLAAYKSADSAAAKQQWVQDQIDKQSEIVDHAEACSDWAWDVQKLIEGEKEMAKKNRRDIIIGRISDLGWGDELDNIPWFGPEDIPIVQKACRKDLTESVLESLDEHLIAFMEEIKARRLEREHRIVTDKRLADLREARDQCIATLPANYIHPTTGELFHLPFIQDIISTLSPTASFSGDDLELIKRSFNDINQQWQRDIESQLRDIASKGYKEDVNPETVVGLATTFFVCTCCTLRYMRYPAVLMHRCPAKFSSLKWEDELDMMVGSSGLSAGEAYWHNKETILVKPKHTEFMASVVSMTGLDPKTATAQDMDALDPIYECLSCNNFKEGRATMSWTTTIAHAFDYCVNHLFKKAMGMETGYEVILLDESEAQLIRPRMRDARERMLRRASPYDIRSNTVIICAICRRRGSFMDLWLHLKKDHGKVKPASEDIVPTIYSDQIPPIYLHWPPRDDLEDFEENENFDDELMNSDGGESS